MRDTNIQSKNPGWMCVYSLGTLKPRP